ncbi:MAG: tRNA preQ1(34) S-adenosylmethionine ribosyltransferase-isomerase QueA [Verrucomicrobiota bacterium]|nr:tRNA preQ1(34) S-adenosylmethionine ribosyltransferase-isomerase QueA [Verrucomicrobiota bacterium]
MRTTDFDFELPPHLIAQHPVLKRDQSRLLVFLRATGQIQHLTTSDLPKLLSNNDLLVFNNSRVIPARLRGVLEDSGSDVEFLLLEEVGDRLWWCMAKPAKRLRKGRVVQILTLSKEKSGCFASLIEKNQDGHCLMQFNAEGDFLELLNTIGEVPLPPYINRPARTQSALDAERYQTIYANPPGSVAAPTAGLHFTPELLNTLEESGIKWEFVTLHVGPGTFAPVKAEELQEHTMHEERFFFPEKTAQSISQARKAGKRIVAVGTTSLRVLESVALRGPDLAPMSWRTKIFIYPPYQFKLTDALLTNFHLPKSTLLMLVSAFLSPGTLEGREIALELYRIAIKNEYRFFSYGDAMLIL